MVSKAFWAFTIPSNHPSSTTHLNSPEHSQDTF